MKYTNGCTSRSTDFTALQEFTLEEAVAHVIGDVDPYQGGVVEQVEVKLDNVVRLLTAILTETTDEGTRLRVLQACNILWSPFSQSNS